MHNAQGIGMVLIGLGLGQLMQTLTLAAQNSVAASDIGVATASATFFRQMGGTLGVAVFISILFNRLPEAIKAAFENKEVAAGVSEAANEITQKAMAGELPANDPNVEFLKNMAAWEKKVLAKPWSRAHFHYYLCWVNYYDYCTANKTGLIDSLQSALAAYDKAKGKIPEIYKVFAITKLAKAPASRKTWLHMACRLKTLCTSGKSFPPFTVWPSA